MKTESRIKFFGIGTIYNPLTMKNIKNLEQIKKQFEIETGVSKSNIMEIITTDISYTAYIYTLDRNFFFRLTENGRAKKKSFIEE